MIIENNNNSRNINLNGYQINYDKLVLFSKKLVFFIFMFTILIFTSYRIYFCYKEIIHIKNGNFDKTIEQNNNTPINIIYDRRNLKSNATENEKNLNKKSNVSFLDKEKEIEELIKERFNGDYSFILNITSNEYIGNWSKLILTQNNFFDRKIDEGIAELSFQRTRSTNNLIVNLGKSNSFRIDIILREGKYIDKYIKINFTFSILDNIEHLLKNNDIIVLYNNNSKIDYANVNFLKDRKKEKIEKGNVTLIFEKEDYSYASSYKKRIMSQFFNVKLIITSKELNVTINSEINNSDVLKQKVRIYSFILSVFGLIEIFYILKLIMKINEHHEIGNRLSILSICINCYLKVIICIIHFFISISTADEDMSYQFGVPTIIYFFGFTGFELKLLLLVFKTRNNAIINREMYRKKLLCFYFFFYVFLSNMVFNIKGCLTNFYLILFAYSFPWLSQILYSIQTNTRPPISRMFIICSSIGKLYLPIYIKGIDGNIFDLKPSYIKVSILIIITFVEVIILLLQKSFGARTLLPKKYRKNGFDYYRDKVNIELHVSKNPVCVICLENLSVEVDENFNTVQAKRKTKNICNKLLHICLVDKLIKIINKWLENMEGKNTKKKYMITPCDHVFHTVCLEKWMRQKNVCPYCKGDIPPLE